MKVEVGVLGSPSLTVLMVSVDVKQIPPTAQGQVRAGIVQWLERRTRDKKVAGSSPGRSGGKVFFSRVTFCIRSTTVLPQ